MLGMLGAVPMCGALPNPWKKWVDHILKQKKNLGFKKAALVKFDGLHIATSAGILVTEAELKKLAGAFCDPNTNNNNCDVSDRALRHSDVSSKSSSLTEDICETLTLCGKTYIIKTKDNQQIVAFNGSKCYIITKTRTMYIIALTESRSKREAASHWLRTIAENFKSKNF